MKHITATLDEALNQIETFASQFLVEDNGRLEIAQVRIVRDGTIIATVTCNDTPNSDE